MADSDLTQRGEEHAAKRSKREDAIKRQEEVARQRLTPLKEESRKLGEITREKQKKEADGRTKAIGAAVARIYEADRIRLRNCLNEVMSDNIKGCEK